MDVNGSKFHVVVGKSDWGQCFPLGDDRTPSIQTLSALWETGNKAPVNWDRKDKGLQLARQTPLFRRSREKEHVPIENRRGAGRDRYGHWYWINERRDGIRFLAANAQQSVSFWRAEDERATGENEWDDFRVIAPPPSPQIELCGLAVTTTHYLVVGSITEHGLLIFDLHRGGPPTLLKWPETTKFAPWDIAARPDGGLLVLDRKNLTYWRLDEHFRLMADLTNEAATFQPEGYDRDAQQDELPNRTARRLTPRGFSLGADKHPISIEPGPDGHVLILDTPEDITTSSVIYEYDGETLIYSASVREAVNVVHEDAQSFVGRGLDFAYISCSPDAPCANLSGGPQGDGKTTHILYIVEERGNQAIAFEMERDPIRLVAQPDYLPMRRWGERALVTAGERVYYDLQERWIPLQVYDDCHYTTRATLVTSAAFEVNIPEQPFDSNIPGCIWHRLLMDAEIPANTFVSIRARAADDPELLQQSAWIEQPKPYLRDRGTDLPYYDPFAKRRYHTDEPPPVRAPDNGNGTVPPSDDTPPVLTDRTGTWEILFQRVHGRYIQLEITLEGTGRSTPSLYTLRLWYPRFSYSEHYLPAIYREAPVPASFLERWLANFEGFFTHIEGSIEQVHQLFDPRTAPRDTLDWLAGWMGLVLDPLWSEKKRRFLIRHAYDLYQMRGTVPGLEVAIRMYVEEDLSDQIFERECWGQSRVRIVEDYLTRTVSRLLLGDTSAEDAGAADGAGGGESQGQTEESRRQRVIAAAHCFTVLLPHDLTYDEERMVERIVDVNKPVHTRYRIRRYWDLFRVGEARLGLDTHLGHSAYFVPQLLGDVYLPDGYLAAPYPYDVEDRLVMGRDRLGDMPEL